MVRLLIDAGADVDIMGRNGNTALIEACSQGNEDIVTQLLKAGADINAKDFMGRTAYDYAKKSNNPVVIELVTQHITRRRENRLMASEDMLPSAGQAQTEAVSAATNASTASMTQSRYVGRIGRFLAQCSEAATRCVSARGPRR